DAVHRPGQLRQFARQPPGEPHAIQRRIGIGIRARHSGNLSRALVACPTRLNRGAAPTGSWAMAGRPSRRARPEISEADRQQRAEYAQAVPVEDYTVTYTETYSGHGDADCWHAGALGHGRTHRQAVPLARLPASGLE